MNRCLGRSYRGVDHEIQQNLLNFAKYSQDKTRSDFDKENLFSKDDALHLSRYKVHRIDHPNGVKEESFPAHRTRSMEKNGLYLSFALLRTLQTVEPCKAANRRVQSLSHPEWKSWKRQVQRIYLANAQLFATCMHQ